MFILYNMGEVSYNWIGADWFEVKSETERFTEVCPRCHQNPNPNPNSYDQWDTTPSNRNHLSS